MTIFCAAFDWYINPSNAEATFAVKFSENHLNPVMLVLIRKLLLSTLR